MRFAMLLAVVGCAGAPKMPALDLLDEEVFHPPAATFRWALHPVTCDQDLRSTVDTCEGRDEIEHLVAVYAPVEDRDSQVVILRYDGPHVGAPLRWQHKVDFGPAPHSATVTIVRDTAITAVVSNGAARVIAIDNETGRVMGTATIVESGSMSVQVEGISDYARIHVLTTNGGTVAVMHPRTARIVTKREIPESAIIHPADDIELEREASRDASVEDVRLAWEHKRLVLRRGKQWFRFLRAVEFEGDQSAHHVTLHRHGSRFIATVFDTQGSRVEVFAFDHETGKMLWRSAVTGATRLAFTRPNISVAIADDQLVVNGTSHTHAFVCSYGIADGVERACVDSLAKVTRRSEARPHERVFDFKDEIVTP